MAKDEINFDALDFEDGNTVRTKENKVIGIVPDIKSSKSDKCDTLNVDIVREYPYDRIEALVKSGLLKLKEIEKELNSENVEREEAIRYIMYALISAVAVFLLGPPGAGKSHLIECVCKKIIGGKYFYRVLNKTSDPAEIVGPLSLKAMEKDSYRRNTEGTLIDAMIGLLDEIFKGNSPTNNILLPIINEKKFVNDNKIIKLPLITLFTASNEIPEDQDDQSALYDRLIVRMFIDDVQDPVNISKMSRIFLDKRSGKFFKNKNVPTITIEELLAMQVKAERIEVSQSLIDEYTKLKMLLQSLGIKYSSRRHNEGFKLMQAKALYEGREKVDTDDLLALKYTIWNDFKDIPQVTEHILKLANPYEKEINALMDKYAEYKTSIDNEKDEFIMHQKIMEARASFTGLYRAFDKIMKEAQEKGRDVSEMKAKKNQVKQYMAKKYQEATGITDDELEGK